MENKEKMSREARDDLYHAIESLIGSDPDMPFEIRAGIKVASAVRALHEQVNKLLELFQDLVDIEDIGHLQELEQYAKLVTEGIRQYLAAINYGPKTGGAK